ncbi:MAG: flagellar assembly peptidoglycan hydrolase FlgJ [Gammaproteobacteria bacterium]|nr:flagellar assembly peptidoglycan hydrolase FlgJ [Gammaproteobacteria bacterium]
METKSANYFDLDSLNQYRDSAKTDQRETLRAAVKEFEAYFLNLMLKNMRSANEVLGGEHALTSNDVSFYNEMHDQQLALELSRSSKFGIGDILFRQLAQSLPQDAAEKADKISEPASLPQRSVNSSKSSAATPVNDNNASQFAPFASQINLNVNFGPAATVDSLRRASPEINQTTNTAPSQTEAKLNRSNKQAFIESIKPYAIQAAEKIGVHPGVLIAQAALETGWGKFMSRTEAGNESNNLFGIKATSSWQGDSVRSSTIEFENGIPQKVMQKFRSYTNLEQSFADYVDLITGNPRYQEAVNQSHDPKSYLNHIQQGGYATDPQYADKIHGIFIRESLFQLTD